LNTKEISPDNNSSGERKLADEFLQTIVKSSNKKKVLVHFKFKDAHTECREWLTYKQYRALRTIKCLEYCRVATSI
jgi:hypothetical protein